MKLFGVRGNFEYLQVVIFNCVGTHLLEYIISYNFSKIWLFEINYIILQETSKLGLCNSCNWVTYSQSLGQTSLNDFENLN